MYSMLDALELCSSPASMMNGRPSTNNCVAAPFFLISGRGGQDGAGLRLCPTRGQKLQHGDQAKADGSHIDVWRD